MQAMNCYQISQYTAVDIPHSLATSPMDLMSPMHLMISATVKIVELISESKNDEFKNQYPDWKYFVAEIRQYVGQDNVPSTFPLYSISFVTDLQYQIVIEHDPAKYHENRATNANRKTDGCQFCLRFPLIRFRCT